ncbi:MAG: YdiY family protein [Gammaproteobacteria bacterium]
MAWADSVHLANGDRLSGSVLRMDAELLWLSTPYAAELKLPRSQVIRIETDAPVRVRLDDGTTVDGRLQGGADESVRIQVTGLGEAAALPIGRIAAINPPPQPTRTVLSGRASVGGSVANGNTDAQTLHLSGELVARNPSQRVTLEAELNQAEQDGVDTAENARLGMQYDHFLARQTYLYASTRFDHDAQADLDLRSTIGVGAGRQILDRDDLKLSIEGGLSLVNEDYGSAPDERFPGARLGLRYEQTLWQGRLSLFHTSDLLLSLEAIDDALYQSRTGVRVPMGNGLGFGAQVHADYDAVPAPGKQTTDTALIFKLDYTL